MQDTSFCGWDELLGLRRGSACDPIDGRSRSRGRDSATGSRACFWRDGYQALNVAVATGLPGSEDPLAWLARKKNKEWLPKPPRVTPVMSFSDVSFEIAAAATEAYRCRTAAKGHRAAILLVRSVIEATAKSKGIASGVCSRRSTRLYDQRLIRPDVRDGAHEVRHLGKTWRTATSSRVSAPRRPTWC
jgi:hypothetical protein